MLQTTFMRILALVVGCVSTYSWAADRKAWLRLTDCQYLEQTYNDGDSFHVQCGDQAFVVRLYFVDAPESTLRYPERTRNRVSTLG